MNDMQTLADIAGMTAELIESGKLVCVVRCKDCKHNARCEIAFGCNGNREWYCADGERAEYEERTNGNE